MSGAGPTAQYRVDPDGVAVITLTNPPVNALHPAGELAFSAAAELICCRDPLAALLHAST